MGRRVATFLACCDAIRTITTEPTLAGVSARAMAEITAAPHGSCDHTAPKAQHVRLHYRKHQLPTINLFKNRVKMPPDTLSGTCLSDPWEMSHPPPLLHFTVGGLVCIPIPTQAASAMPSCSFKKERTTIPHLQRRHVLLTSLRHVT